jgi:flagellar hook assembly protein FlgD
MAGDPPEAAAVRVRLVIYDLRGRLVRTLIDEERGPGRYAVHWDGRDDRGTRVGSGVYLYRLQVAAFVETRKMVVVR